MNLKDFVKFFHNGNVSHFARSMDVKPNQAQRWKRLLRMAKMHRCWFIAAVVAYLFIIYITVWSQ